MKTIFKILLVSLFFSLIAMGLMSCNSKPNKDFTVNMQSNNLPTSSFDCDSVNMKSLNHVEYYVSGHKMNAYAENITIESNN